MDTLHFTPRSPRRHCSPSRHGKWLAAATLALASAWSGAEEADLLPPNAALLLKRAAPASAMSFTESRAALNASKDGTDIVLTKSSGLRANADVLNASETKPLKCAPLGCVRFDSQAIEVRAPLDGGGNSGEVWTDGKLSKNTSIALKWASLFTGWTGGEKELRSKICQQYRAIRSRLPEEVEKKYPPTCRRKNIIELRDWAEEPFAAAFLTAKDKELPTSAETARRFRQVQAVAADKRKDALREARAKGSAVAELADSSLRDDIKVLNDFVAATDAEKLGTAFGDATDGGFVVAADASYGTNQVNYLNPVSLEGYTRRQASSGANLSLGWIPSGATTLLLQVRLGVNRARADEDEAIHCLPGATSTTAPSCVTGVFETGKRERKHSSAIGARWLVPEANLGLALNFSRITGEKTKWDMPVYFVPDSKGNLIGGLVFRGGGGGKSSLGVFVILPVE